MLHPVSEPSWYEQAACRGRGWEPFFDDPDTSTALRTCAQCVVRTRCLRYALAQQIDTGIWGGLTPRQRRRVHSAARVA